jgi:uncharacterized membrane protein
VPLLPGIVLGFGLGMFLDGIVLHQLLQWHHLVSQLEPTGDLAGLEANTFWDGVFHASGWVVTFTGVLLVVRRGTGREPLPRLLGLLLVGWGAFNVTDQVVFHLALGAHHIREGPDAELYDWAFFALGVLLVAGGALLARRTGSAAGQGTEVQAP